MFLFIKPKLICTCLRKSNIYFWCLENDQAPEVIKLFPGSTQLSTKFILLINVKILLINVKMPTIVGIITFISMINTTSERFTARNFFICRYFSFYEQLICLFDSILYVPSINFQLNRDGSSWVEPVLS